MPRTGAKYRGGNLIFLERQTCSGSPRGPLKDGGVRGFENTFIHLQLEDQSWKLGRMEPGTKMAI